MIDKQDILDRAGEWDLRPDVVEKDYVLGWLLCAFARHPVTAPLWVFKGGTCLKKCFFETYRFSEDLDFSLLPEAPYTAEAITRALQEIARNASGMSGIEIPEDRVRIDVSQDLRGQQTFKGRIYFRGPLGRRDHRRVLLDLTQHEPVLDECAARRIFHPYPDDLAGEVAVQTYSLPELLAEKTRALYERTRPRDLYDVVFLLENLPDILNFNQTRSLFRAKCRVKGLVPPDPRSFVAQVLGFAELRSEWEHMLGHQLPELPPLDPMLERLPTLLGWVEAAVVLPSAQLDSPPISAAEPVLAPAGIHYWGRGVGLETIRFAGTNRLMVAFTYHGRPRLVEPYSIRRASTGNLLFYGWEHRAGHIKAFNVAKIRDVRATDQPFTPRYRVEFTSSERLQALPSATPPSHVGGDSNPRSGRRRTVARGYDGRQRYVFRCPLCQKEFWHKNNDSRLREHKSKGGWDCSGRRGYLVRVE